MSDSAADRRAVARRWFWPIAALFVVVGGIAVIGITTPHLHRAVCELEEPDDN